MVDRFVWASCVVVALTLALVPACDGESEDGEVNTKDPCETEDRAQDYVRGLEVDGNDGVVIATLVESVPAPPAKGDNSWTVQIVDDAGSPIQDLQITTKPLMPDHGHGSSVEPTVSAQEDGVYIIDEINFVMAGYWETTLELSDEAGSTVDSAMFRFCIRE